MITVEDIEKRLAVKQAGGDENPDGTQPKENQQSVPDAKSTKTRNPWIDAGVGAAGGGLLGSALGYLYGHKGKWLAYDALAGGLAGGGVGYMIGSSNNKAIAQNENKLKQEGSKASAKAVVKKLREQQQARDAREKTEMEEAQKKYADLQKNGGRYSNWTEHPIESFKAYREENILKRKGGDLKTLEEKRQRDLQDKKNEIIAQSVF